MDVTSTIAVLQEEIFFRNEQIDTLLLLMGQETQPSVPSIFLYGHSCTGKSHVVDTLMKHLQLPHVITDCVEYFQSHMMYDHVLNQLNGHVPAEDNDFAVPLKCSNMNSFIRMLQTVVRETNEKNKTIYLIFRRAERLRDMEPNILPAFLRLQELTSLNITCIFESNIVWDKFRMGTGFAEPYMLFFPEYTKDEMLEILMLDQPGTATAELYKSYLRVILNVFLLPCHNLKELRYLAQLHWGKYIEPVNDGEVEEDDSINLWRRIVPHLKKALQTVYLREVTSSQWERMLLEEDEKDHKEGLSGLSQSKVELPFYSKYLLIATYLASYNPASSDKRFFSKRCAKTPKRSNLAHQKKSAERSSAHLLGPKPFPLNRMMAIFYAIVEGNVIPSANIFSQVSHLVTLGLLSQSSSSDALEAPKYKCLVSLDLIKQIAKSVDFDIIQHLYDFT